MKKMQLPLMRTSSTLSNLSASSSRLGFTGTRKSTPTTPKYERKLKYFKEIILKMIENNFYYIVKNH
jgi:hypothetical protein